MGDESRRKTGRGGVFASFSLSHLIAILLLAGLVYQAGIWNILANTRLLDPLIEGGVIRYHDGNIGLVDGVADQEHYLKSQDPIDYRLVGLAALIYFLYWAVKGVQFHGVARFVGLKGTCGQHARAWLYGQGVARFFPLRFGDTATGMALEGQGEDPEPVRQTFAVMATLVVIFEILLFWVFGLWVTSYSVWFIQSFCAIGILGVAWFFARKTKLLESVSWKSQRSAYRALAEKPATLAKLGFLSSLSMLLDDLTPFVIAMAFTGNFVILNVSFFVIQSGVVAGYIARRISITPHGIGQFEWAFALALYFSGVGFPEAATIALLDMVLRHGTGFIVHMAIVLWYGVETNLKTTMDRFCGTATAEAQA